MNNKKKWFKNLLLALFTYAKLNTQYGELWRTLIVSSILVRCETTWLQSNISTANAACERIMETGIIGKIQRQLVSLAPCVQTADTTRRRDPIQCALRSFKARPKQFTFDFNMHNIRRVVCVHLQQIYCSQHEAWIRYEIVVYVQCFMRFRPSNLSPPINLFHATSSTSRLSAAPFPALWSSFEYAIQELTLVRPQPQHPLTFSHSLFAATACDISHFAQQERCRELCNVYSPLPWKTI